MLAPPLMSRSLPFAPVRANNPRLEVIHPQAILHSVCKFSRTAEQRRQLQGGYAGLGRVLTNAVGALSAFGGIVLQNYF